MNTKKLHNTAVHHSFSLVFVNKGELGYRKMWLQLVLYSLLLCFIEGKTIQSRKKVCVIGAGMTGLASVKRLAEHTDEFEPVVFEKNSDVGGLWIYTDKTMVDEHGLPVHSSVYKNLRTTGAKELMAWPDYRNFTDDEHSSVSHEVVLQYMRNYTTHFKLRQYIKLNTLVEYVAPLNDDEEDWQKTKWLVITRNLNTQKYKKTICNAIMVCNGHYSKPNIPVIPGIENFQGTIIHSHDYRKPEVFANKTVAILGAGISGIDISLDISTHAKKIYLSHRRDKLTRELPKNVEQVPGIIKADGNELVLSNGSTIIADAFIYCTGYLPDTSFLDETCGIKVEQTHVLPLYKQMINAEHPSMAFIGLATSRITPLLPYVQSQYFVALLQGEVQLPSYEEMIKDADTLPPGAPKGHYHVIAEPWDYVEELGQAAGFQALPSYFKPAFKVYEAYRDTHEVDYKDALFRFHSNDTLYLVHA